MRGVSQEALIFRLNPKIILGAITSNHMYRKRDLPEWTIKCSKGFGTGSRDGIETKAKIGLPTNSGDEKKANGTLPLMIGRH